MAELQSSPVLADQDVLAAQYNKLRTDLLAVHGHSAGKGGEVDHSELADTAPMAGVYHTHTDIETHLSGGAGAFNDSPGGAYGVHGLEDGCMVAGSKGFQMAIQAGGPVWTEHDVAFPVAFAHGTKPFVVATMVSGPRDCITGIHHCLGHCDFWVWDITNKGFKFDYHSVGWRNCKYHWVALGIA